MSSIIFAATGRQEYAAEGCSLAHGKLKHSPLLVRPLACARPSAQYPQLHERHEDARTSQQALAGSVRLVPSLLRCGCLPCLLALQEIHSVSPEPLYHPALIHPLAEG